MILRFVNKVEKDITRGLITGGRAHKRMFSTLSEMELSFDSFMSIYIKFNILLSKSLLNYLM